MITGLERGFRLNNLDQLSVMNAAITFPGCLVSMKYCICDEGLLDYLAVQAHVLVQCGAVGMVLYVLSMM